MVYQWGCVPCFVMLYIYSVIKLNRQLETLPPLLPSHFSVDKYGTFNLGDRNHLQKSCICEVFVENISPQLSVVSIDFPFILCSLSTSGNDLSSEHGRIVLKCGQFLCFHIFIAFYGNSIASFLCSSIILGFECDENVFFLHSSTICMVYSGEMYKGERKVGLAMMVSSYTCQTVYTLNKKLVKVGRVGIKDGSSLVNRLSD